MSTNTGNIIIRFAHVATQPSNNRESGAETPITRLVGFVSAKHLLPLFDQAELTANPRSSRRNSVVEDILQTLQASPELFRYKSKGILIGTADYLPLERNRFRICFSDPDIEGILDGGHNMLAIGLHILQQVLDEKAWRRIKSWAAMKEAWDENRDLIDTIKDSFDFYVPVELLVPSGTTEDDKDAFLMPLLEVCEARNNNAQLPIEAKSNKQGFYDAMKAVMPDSFRNRVEWRPNYWEDTKESRPVKVRDLVALTWIPLNLLNEEKQLPKVIGVSPQNIYRNKGECSKRFEELMSLDDVTQKSQGPRRELTNRSVRSAFKVLSDLPRLYDLIYEQFPGAYNQENRRFGANPIVKTFAPERRRSAIAAGKEVKGYINSQPTTPFFRHNVYYKYPEGLIIPLVYGLKGLMVVEDGEVRWAVGDPDEFVKEHLARIANAYQLVMNMARWDPQKISKDPNSYEFAVREFRNALREFPHTA